MTSSRDQPPEHWAGAASLDPTPVWKQYLILVVLLLGALAVIGIVAAFALAPQLATPPALVPGDRLVLARSALPAVPQPAVRIGPGLVPEERAFWIRQLAEGEYLAVSAAWPHPETAERCAVVAAVPAATDPAGAAWRLGGTCEGTPWTFTRRGEPLAAPRGLDRYLVSVDGDRVIVNLSRAIRGVGRTAQPTRSPL